MNRYEEKDEGEIIGRIMKFYKLIGGNCGDRRDWPEFSKLFSENATLSVFRITNEVNIISSKVPDYVSRLDKYLENNDFWERGADFKVAISNHIAFVNSTYEASTEPDFRTIMKRGTNFIQLVKIEDSWKIFSMLWEDNP